MRFGIIAIALCFWAANPGQAQEIHHPLCLYGCPFGAPITNDVVIREIYILSSNDTTKFADWTAYRVTAETIGPTEDRNFKSDPLLASYETLEPSDYTGANAALGTERGHLVPLASFTGTPHWRDTNYLSNITPQAGALNGGRWGTLEGRVRTLAQQSDVDAVYVFAGTLYERAMPSLPQANEPHVIPSGYWKIVATSDDDVTSVAAFIFDQDTPSGGSPCSHLLTVDEVEQRSALDFFTELSLSKQATLEGVTGTLASRLGCQS